MRAAMLTLMRTPHVVDTATLAATVGLSALIALLLVA